MWQNQTYAVEFSTFPHLLVLQMVMTKGSREINAKIKKVVVARQAEREAEQQKIIRWETNEERESRRKYLKKGMRDTRI